MAEPIIPRAIVLGYILYYREKHPDHWSPSYKQIAQHFSRGIIVSKTAMWEAVKWLNEQDPQLITKSGKQPSLIETPAGLEFWNTYKEQHKDAQRWAETGTNNPGQEGQG